MLNEIPAATVPGCTFFGANVRTPDDLLGLPSFFPQVSYRLLLGSPGNRFSAWCLIPYCLPPFPRISNIHKPGKGTQIKKLATSIFQKKIERVFWNKPTSPTGRFSTKLYQCHNWATMDKWRKYFFDSALSFFGNLWTPDVFLCSHPFCCKPATGAFGVRVVCVVHLETWFLTRSCTQALFCLHYQQHELRKGFLRFAFFGARSELCWCLVCSCKIPPSCLVMVSLLGMWTPDGCFGARNRTTHCFWHVLSLARSGA